MVDELCKLSFLTQQWRIHQIGVQLVKDGVPEPVQWMSEKYFESLRVVDLLNELLDRRDKGEDETP